MREVQRLSPTLKSGGFSLQYFLGKQFSIGFTAQCCAIAGAAIAAVLSASAIDHSLILPKGNVGLLQHPAIWAFFALQIALPIIVRQSVKKLFAARKSLRLIGALDDKPYTNLVAPLARYLNLEEIGSKITATFLYTIGLIAFIWNTYQNQFPDIIVPFDFWDSKNYVFGFWITRVYKFYLFVWLFPYVALLHTSILVVALRLIRKARVAGALKLLPFHPDGVGGLGFFPDLVTRPLVISVLFAIMPMISVIYIHRAPAVTPLMGLSILILITGVAYFVPILALRTDIIATKQAMVTKLRQLQQKSFSHVIDCREVDVKQLKAANESISCSEDLCSAVQNITHYPHLKRLIGSIAILMTPAATSLIERLYQDIPPMIHPWISRQ